MGTISDKLMRIINTKEDIRQALISKGYDVPTSIPFKEYAKMISDLPCRVDSFPDIEGIVARYSALGLTNEQMAANPVWADKTGNDHDLQMKNFAWGGMSGVGGYTENYNSNKWYKVELRIDATWTYKSFNARSIKDNRSAQLFYQSSLSDTGFRVLSCTIKVSGLTDGQGIEYVSNGTQQFVIMRIENDGIYHLPSFDFGAKNAYYGFKFLKLQESCNITIEQLPLYPGALVFDGVDDYGVCDNFPILTKEKGYTVVVLRQWITYNPNAISAIATNASDQSFNGAFTFENYNKGAEQTISYGATQITLQYSKSPFSWQTTSKYNGVNIANGNKDATNSLVLGRSYPQRNEFANFAIWELVFLDHDATEEELTKIKDYFVKTYPWLFFDQAWTVTGKTNEDEDRATIANITGNGNDLVLSNVAFSENSGYGSYPFGMNVWNPDYIADQPYGTVHYPNDSKSYATTVKNNATNFRIKFRLRGLPEGGSFLIRVFDMNDLNTVLKTYTYTENGIHEFVYNDPNKPARIILYNGNTPSNISEFYLDIIPEYEGYLVTDGVDDKIVSSVFEMGKDFAIVGDWKFIDNKKSGTGLVKGSSFYIYNTMIGLDLYINSGSVKNSLDGIKSINAACSDGRAYDRNWNEILANTGNVVGSGSMLEVSSSGGRFDLIAFKNLAIYPRILSKDDCIKAYNYLQTLKAK
jgi:hypothetical protein|nr:MAG: hypothetical protein [Bacteriophage sp.]